MTFSRAGLARGRRPIAGSKVRKATLASMVAKAGPGLRFNEHLEGDGPTVTCLQDGARRHRVEAAGLALSLRPLARLAQVQEPGGSGSEARGGRGLGQVTRRAELPYHDCGPEVGEW
jgi:hypothetical protein